MTHAGNPMTFENNRREKKEPDTFFPNHPPRHHFTSEACAEAADLVKGHSFTSELRNVLKPLG